MITLGEKSLSGCSLIRVKMRQEGEIADCSINTLFPSTLLISHWPLPFSVKHRNCSREKKGEQGKQREVLQGVLWESLQSGFYLPINGILKKIFKHITGKYSTSFQFFSHSKFNQVTRLSQRVALSTTRYYRPLG